MSLTVQGRLWTMAVMAAALPLWALWCIIGLEDMAEMQAQQAMLVAAAAHPVGSADFVPMNVASGMAPMAGGIYPLQAGLTLALLLSVFAGGVLADTMRRLATGRDPVTVPVRAPDADIPVERSEPGPSAVDDLVTAMHTLGWEMRRQVGEVSHEMRTPLAVIAGSLPAVRRILPPDHVRAERSIELIDKSCEKLVSILDSHRDTTSRLVDSFLGVHVRIDIGTFLQDFIAHAGIGTVVSLVHPPQPLIVRTQADELKELMRLFLVAGPQRCDGMKIGLSIADRENWTEVTLRYARPDGGRFTLSALPAVEWALGECRGSLDLMSATLKTTVEPGGEVLIHLFLPVA